MSSPSQPGLDSPPPSPANFPDQQIPEVGQGADSSQALTQMGFEIDKALTTLATAMTGPGGDKIAQAQRLIKIGIAEALSDSGGGAGSVLPGAAGMSLPSGGLGPTGP